MADETEASEPEGLDIDDIDDSEYVTWSDDLDADIRTYMEAVRQNVDTTKVRPRPNYVLVQVMPHDRVVGGGVIAHWDTVPDPERIPGRYGTVLAVGENHRDLFDPGDEVYFSHMLGKKWAGHYNPLAVEGGDGVDWSDEIRFFKLDEDHYEIVGSVEYDLIGKTVEFEPPGEDPRGVEVVDESALFGGIAEVVDSDGERKWVPGRYLETHPDKPEPIRAETLGPEPVDDIDFPSSSDLGPEPVEGVTASLDWEGDGDPDAEEVARRMGEMDEFDGEL